MAIDICADLPSAFWNQKKHIVTLPYEDNFSEDDIPTKSCPCQMNAELVEFYKKEIDNLLQKGLIKPSKSPWSCTAFYVNNAAEKECGIPRMDPPWVTRGRGKGNNSRGRGRSSPGSSVSGSSYGFSSSYSPIIQRGGMSLVKLKTSQKEASSSLSIHLEDIPEDNPLYAELRAYFSQKEKGDTFASIAKDDIDVIKSYEKVEGDKLREQAKENKKARTGNYDYSQQKSGGGNLLQFQQKSSTPVPSSTSVPSSKFRNNKKGRTSGSKSQGSVTGTKTYPTCPKYGKNHPGECLAGKEGSFGCGQFGHRLRDCPSREGQRGNNGRDQSTTSAAPTGRPTQQVNSSGTGGGQCQNRLYAL
uniref:Zinc knuckle family protein n=1 Tax=Solanum tuberosum TaxID=4113 RepID=M1DL10_SOLTU